MVAVTVCIKAVADLVDDDAPNHPAVHPLHFVTHIGAPDLWFGRIRSTLGHDVLMRLWCSPPVTRLKQRRTLRRLGTFRRRSAIAATVITAAAAARLQKILTNGARDPRAPSRARGGRLRSFAGQRDALQQRQSNQANIFRDFRSFLARNRSPQNTRPKSGMRLCLPSDRNLQNSIPLAAPHRYQNGPTRFHIEVSGRPTVAST